MRTILNKESATIPSDCRGGARASSPFSPASCRGASDALSREELISRDDHAQRVSGKMPDTATKMVALPRGSRSEYSRFPIRSAPHARSLTALMKGGTR
jgi:hypothetical protein